MKNAWDRWVPRIMFAIFVYIVLMLLFQMAKGHPGGSHPPYSVKDLQVWDAHACTVYHDTDYYYEPARLRPLLPRFLPYAGVVPATRAGHDIEHIVARHEAHVSGACHWHHSKRRAFAQDLFNITLATPRVNRVEKSDRDFAQWRPAHNVAWFAQRVIDVKAKWKLTVDPCEYEALRHVFHHGPPDVKGCT